MRADLDLPGVNNKCRHHSDLVLLHHALIVAVSLDPGHLNTGLHKHDFRPLAWSATVRPEPDHLDLTGFDQLLNLLLRLPKLLLDDVLASRENQAESQGKGSQQ